jgi:hypothetical protein
MDYCKTKKTWRLLRQFEEVGSVLQQKQPHAFSPCWPGNMEILKVVMQQSNKKSHCGSWDIVMFNSVNATLTFVHISVQDHSNVQILQGRD